MKVSFYGSSPPRLVIRIDHRTVVMISPWFFQSQYRLTPSAFANSKGDSDGWIGTYGPIYVERRPKWEFVRGGPA